MRAILLLSLFSVGAVHAANCTIDLKGDDAMKFDKTEVTVSLNRPDFPGGSHS
jgi:azurin